MRFFLPLLTLLPSAVVGEDSSENCLGIPTVENRGYHHQCDLATFRNYKFSLPREMIQKKLTASGIHNVPDKKTVVCPLSETNLVEDGMVTGEDSMWFVENEASSPIVLAWVHEGVEYSAVNRKITPPQADPEAILAPGSWKAIHTFDGEIFYGRQLLGGVAGPLLIQHRVGLAPIQGKERTQNKRETVPRKKLESHNHNNRVLAEQYDWATCNGLDIGFRNYAGEPLNGYWLDPVPGQCKEHLKFHLGLNARPANFARDLDSNTKFEKTYIGHTFVFRSAATGELVATYTNEPTRVRDCPNKSATAPILVSGGAQEIKINRRDANQDGGVNMTELLAEYLEYATDEEIEMLKSSNATIAPFRPIPLQPQSA